MSAPVPGHVGRVISLWRYPVRSMIGEALYAAEVTEKGILGDHVIAIVDQNDGTVATANDPERWERLLDGRVSFVDTPTRRRLPAVRFSLEERAAILSTDPDVELVLSTWLGRDVRLAQVRGSVSGPYFETAPIRILTTATLQRLQTLYPAGVFDARRFRPSILVQTLGPAAFLEQDWIGCSLTMGSARFRITEPTPCGVMITLPHDDLPGDPGMLRALVRHAGNQAGVYAEIAAEGIVSAGDPVILTA